MTDSDRTPDPRDDRAPDDARRTPDSPAHGDPHEPTAEFRAALERQIAREFRRERQFDPPSFEHAGRRRRRFATV
ncbi:MAG TPA: hypothetical protein VHV78_08645, partial [Gemmatimonadaceae bacterium]|nr:hypothetical protein [Gemmatimonadaceae bacterium]